MPASLLSVNTGTTRPIDVGGRTQWTGIFKHPLSGSITRVGRQQPAVSTAEANRVMHVARDDRPAIERLLAASGHSHAWRDALSRRLAP